MKVKKMSGIFLSVMAASFVLYGCGAATQQTSQNQAAGTVPAANKKIRIGVAMDNINGFHKYILDGMQKATKKYPDLDVTYVNANGDSTKQMSQLETFITQKVDAIVFLPVDTQSAPQMVDKVNKAHIPIIDVNETFDGVDKATSYVGSESLESGRIEMEQVAKVLNGKGDIAIMDGQMGDEAQIARTQGYKDIIAKNPGIHVILEGSADWDRTKGQTLMENWLHSGKHIDAVVANNDEMAIGAVLALKEAGKLNDILVAGIDATPAGLPYVQNGELKVSVFQDAFKQGGGGIDVAYKAAKGEQVPKKDIIPYQLVTKDNVDKFVQIWKNSGDSN